MKLPGNNRDLQPSSAAKFFRTAGILVQEMPGRKEDVSWGVLYVASNGGGGFFDPLERNPEAIASDVRQSVVSREAGLLVYGTVIDEELGVDAAATRALREQVRSKRRAGMGTL